MTLGTRLVVQSVLFLGGLGFLIFVPAGTLHAWPGWTYLGIFFASTLAMSAYFWKHDRPLLERRLALAERGEEDPTQRVLQALAGPAFLALMLVSGLDVRFGWTRVPVWAIAIANALVAVSMGIVFVVFRANSYASSIVEVGKEQTVVTTGPYARVRHPMYTGGLLLIAATPVALGSFAGEAFAPILFALIVVRMLNEERFLSARLPGYDAYLRTTRWRLLPGVW